MKVRNRLVAIWLVVGTIGSTNAYPYLRSLDHVVGGGGHVGDFSYPQVGDGEEEQEDKQLTKENKYYYGGQYTGTCRADGLYYKDETAFVICSNGYPYDQPCPPGTKTAEFPKYQPGYYYGYADLCTVNLVDYGYGPEFYAPTGHQQSHSTFDTNLADRITYNRDNDHNRVHVNSFDKPSSDYSSNDVDGRGDVRQFRNPSSTSHGYRPGFNRRANDETEVKVKQQTFRNNNGPDSDGKRFSGRTSTGNFNSRNRFNPSTSTDVNRNVGDGSKDRFKLISTDLNPETYQKVVQYNSQSAYQSANDGSIYRSLPRRHHNSHRSP